MKPEPWEIFFKNSGDDYLHPKSSGVCYFGVTVEEMYQHFKARMIAEMTEKGEPE